MKIKMTLGLLILTAGISPLQGAEAPGAFAGAAAATVRRTARVEPKALPRRMTREDCSALAVMTTIAKTRAEMRTLLPKGPHDLADIGAAMDADRRVSEGIQRAFGSSDLVKSEYSKRGECIVTLKLPLERLRTLARDL